MPRFQIEISATHPLDNVIWHALTTRRSHFAETFESARRRPREVTPLSGFEEPSPAGCASLAGLVGEAGTSAVFLDNPTRQEMVGTSSEEHPCSKWSARTGTGLLRPSTPAQDIVELGVTDSTEMVELATLTKPGPSERGRTNSAITWAFVRAGSSRPRQEWHSTSDWDSR